MAHLWHKQERARRGVLRIYQRGKRGTFWVDYLAPDGTRARRSLHTTSREIAGLAAEKLAGLGTEENRGTAREETAPETLEQVLNRWLVHKAATPREADHGQDLPPDRP